MNFLDSNVLLYAEDGRFPSKRQTAIGLVRAGLERGDAVISTQVLNEVYANLIRKLGATKSAAREVVLRYEKLCVVPTTPELCLDAMTLHQIHPVSFWDALILRAALASGCRTLYSEDLQHGQSYEGVHVVNPFLEP